MDTQLSWITLKISTPFGISLLRVSVSQLGSVSYFSDLLITSLGPLIHHQPPHDLHPAYGFLKLSFGLPQVEKRQFHGHALQKRPKGKNGLQSFSPPKLVKDSQIWRSAAFHSQT